MANGFLNFFNALKAKYPLVTNGIVAALLSAAGSLASNIIAKDTLNWVEASAWAFLAAAYVTPILMHYYGWLESRTAKGWSQGQKLVFDQLLFSPIFMFGLLSAHDVVIHTINLKSVDVNFVLFSSRAHIITMLPGVMKLNWLFWIPARFVMLNYVPSSAHMLLGNVLSFVWQIVLSMSTGA